MTLAAVTRDQCGYSFGALAPSEFDGDEDHRRCRYENRSSPRDVSPGCLSALDGIRGDIVVLSPVKAKNKYCRRYSQSIGTWLPSLSPSSAMQTAPGPATRLEPERLTPTLPLVPVESTGTALAKR